MSLAYTDPVSAHGNRPRPSRGRVRSRAAVTRTLLPARRRSKQTADGWLTRPEPAQDGPIRRSQLRRCVRGWMVRALSWRGVSLGPRPSSDRPSLGGACVLCDYRRVGPEALARGQPGDERAPAFGGLWFTSADEIVVWLPTGAPGEISSRSTSERKPAAD